MPIGFLKKMFGGDGDEGAASEVGETVDYQGYAITPTPMRQGGQFVTAGTIAKDFPDGRREHKFIRADTHSSKDEAMSFSVSKARQIIDENGDRIFRNG